MNLGPVNINSYTSMPVSLEHSWPTEIIRGVVIAVDLCIILVIGSLYIGQIASSNDTEISFVYIYALLIVSILYFVISSFAGNFEVSCVMRPLKKADDVIVSIITAFFFFVSIALAFERGEWFPISSMLTLAALCCVVVVAWRFLAFATLKWLSRRRIIGRRMAILGGGEQARRFAQRVRATQPYFVSVVGVFADGESKPGADLEEYPLIGDVAALLSFARASQVDDVVVAMPWSADKEVIAAIGLLKELPVNVYLTTDLIGFELAFRPVMGAFSDLPMFEVVPKPLSGWSSVLKAVEDYLVAGLLVLALAPLFAIIALLIKLDSAGPVFFKQKRLGFNNKEFSIYKFRSMYHNQTPETVVRQARKGDPRVTRVGRVIRATSLDELPQMFTVLNGTMSLVGPRPHAVSHNEEYGRQIRGYFARHRVKPGITGWAQVNGLRGETDTIEKMEARIRHDVYYADNWSLLFDLRILVMTALVVLFQKTAY